MMIPELLHHVRTIELAEKVAAISAHPERRRSRHQHSVVKDRWLLTFALHQAMKHSLRPEICAAAFKRVGLVPFDPAATASLATWKEGQLTDEIAVAVIKRHVEAMGAAVDDARAAGVPAGQRLEGEHAARVARVRDEGFAAIDEANVEQADLSAQTDSLAQICHHEAFMAPVEQVLDGLAGISPLMPSYARVQELHHLLYKWKTLAEATIERGAVKVAQFRHVQQALEGRETPAQLQVRTSTMGAATGAAVFALDEGYTKLLADCDAKAIKRRYKQHRADVIDGIGRHSTIVVQRKLTKAAVEGFLAVHEDFIMQNGVRLDVSRPAGATLEELGVKAYDVIVWLDEGSLNTSAWPSDRLAERAATQRRVSARANRSRRV